MNILRWFLFPLAVLYGGVTKVRNWLFDLGILEEQPIMVPSIAVGNLAVGGTGKTPHVEYLLRLLTPKYRVAMLSRGYGRHTKGLQAVSIEAHPDAVGDEPLQVKRRFPQSLVVVDANRRRGVKWLTQQGAEAIVLDDAFQHRYVRPGIRILLTTYNRPYTKDELLPMGRLREAQQGAKRADIIIVTKCPSALSPATRDAIVQELKCREEQSVFFTCNHYGTPYALFPDTPPYRQSANLAVITGIAHPEPLITHFAKDATVVALRFPDHHRFTKADLQRIEQETAHVSQVITTEKDATRLLPYATSLSVTLRQKIYVQPIEVAFLSDENSFNNIIISYVSTHQRNS